MNATHPINQRFLAYLDQYYPLPRLLKGAMDGTGAAWLLPLLRLETRFAQKERMRRVARRGVPVPATLIQANSWLFKPGKKSLPCLVLFSFEPQVSANAAYMSELSKRVDALKGTNQTNAELRYVMNLTTDERAYKDRRRKLPLSFTGGPTVWVADLWIDRHRLAAGYITERVLPCLAEPGELGALELLPWWVAAEQGSPHTM